MLSRKRTGLLAGCVVAMGAAVYAAGQADTPDAKAVAKPNPAEKQATAAEVKAVEKAAAETPDAKSTTSTSATTTKSTEKTGATEKTGKHAHEGMHLSKSDQRLLQWLVSDNQTEINLAQFVSTRANSPEVKQFAEKMIQDHTAFINKLAALNPNADLDRECADHVADKADKAEDRVHKFEEKSGKVQEKAAKASSNAAENNAAENADSEKADGDKSDKTDADKANKNDKDRNDKKSAKAEDKETKTARRVEKVEQKLDKAGNKLTKADSRAAGCDLLAIKKEISERCFASAKQALEAKEGAEFESCYLGHQVVCHMMMRDTLTVFAEHADADEFKTVLREGLETATAHLEKAQALMNHGAAR